MRRIQVPKFIQAIFPSLICNNKNSGNNIWLTFDDGPCPQATPYILKILKEEKIKATFFLVGEQIDKYPKLFREIVSSGHVVANHSYSHKSGWISKKSEYIKDIEKCQQRMPTNKLFRPPYGKISPLQIKHLKYKYKIILWDVLSWDFSPKISSEKIQSNILENTKSGSIIVLHNNQYSIKKTKGILKETIQELKKKKFLFSTTW